ncbi:MAG: hypothetical protein IPJ85_01950 [Flavobacteriales bacterium]|nr:hypothetical protein [Flavobacteriales bacterium]
MLALTVSTHAWGQARIVINNNAWLRIDNGAWVVVEEPTNAGIQTLGTGGNIRSEGEFNRIRWQIRNTNGVYTIPFTTANSVKMPFTYEAVGGGSNEAQASICFSTYNYGTVAANNWDNNTYRPSDVTHMHNYWTGAPVNNSDNVVDRFWIVDPYSAPAFTYGTRPSIRLGFTHDPGAATGDVRTGNTITGASVVGAQRFNAPVGMWGDYWPAGNWAAGAVNSVTNVNVPPADFFRSWTLSDILQSLPVELFRFSVACSGGSVQLNWTTGSERGASHFRIERSRDAQQFETIGVQTAVGNSQTAIQYNHTDPQPFEIGYYRIAIVDADGSEDVSTVQVATCGITSTAIVNAWDGGDNLHVIISSPHEQTVAFALFDAAGRIAAERSSLVLIEGLNTIEIDQQGMAMGIYTLIMHGADGPLSRKLPVY